MPTPTVGRIVMFKTRGSLDSVFPPRDFAAIITRVYDNNVVSVASFGETGIRFEISVSQGDQPGQWNWPVISGGNAASSPGPNAVTPTQHVEKEV